MISQSDSTISATVLMARAEQGITLMTNVGQLDIQNSGMGDIEWLSVKSALLIAPLTNPSGEISATVFGVLTAGNLQADEITIHATGGLVQQNSTAIQGGTLTLDTNSGNSTLRTDLSDLVIRTGGTGNLTINNIGTSPLTLYINVTDGSLTVDTAGDLLVQSVSSLTDKDTNDISLTATGSIQVGRLQAGQFAATSTDARTLRLKYLSSM
ncbi:MAG: hypothetical protein ACK6EB_42930, partial [Planctomyces sp.]